ncbi:DUF3488 and transglutaminase-like domain-containing protein [Amycolatopsis thermalba]|uniref:DUF3488 and transglutaminase-like domain-containing protein n=1 Tax=Amycolatopsis thermalba TaxID=944492 RepID=A0ABY4NX98_9PSEU|nr:MULTISPECIES: transglutaminase domain-containing protein [Amycolatopsis]UQS24701.1 DUF3488 and transglutaminase-like domain-containing protein [Amycolatopsis thermalba]
MNRGAERGSRIVPVAGVVLAAVVAGLLFAPVFGLRALLVPVAVPAAVVLLVVAVVRGPGLRPLVAMVAGLLAVVETTLWPTTAGGLPTGETLHALAGGVSQSWQLALRSTWPARPEPAVLLFVPLLTLLAAVLGAELLRLSRPLVALVPSLAVVVLSQFYAAASGWGAVAAALAYAVAAGAATTGRGRAEGPRPVFPSAIVAVALAAGCVVVAGVAVPAPPARYSLKDDQLAPLTPVQIANPLDDIAYRLAHPATPVFRLDGAAGVDRWAVAVLDEFDGVNWSPGGRYRTLGSELRPGPEVTVPVEPRTARISAVDLGGPWLPSQTWPAGVSGAEPLVEERQGTLLVPDGGRAGDYTLTWWAPQIPAGSLYGAAIDPDAPGGLSGVGEVPPGIAELADRAVNGTRPTFQAALALERFFRDNYRLATGQNLPTGHSWPQLAEFLLTAKRGTSEQFAAAYVALARVRGIPARLVVGFRAPAGPDVVRNGDVLAWPEVAVEGVGWVPLDPTGTATPGASAGAGLAAATAGARAQLPASQDLLDPPVAAGEGSGEAPAGAGRFPWALTGAIVLGAVLLGVLGVPLAKGVRAWRRRRRGGAGAVVGAWEEVRDRLRGHGVPVTAGMTVRDLATAAAGFVDQSTVDELRSLGRTVDLALWSGAGPDEGRAAQAWTAVRRVRRGLARRGVRAWLRAAFEPGTLLRRVT